MSENGPVPDLTLAKTYNGKDLDPELDVEVSLIKRNHEIDLISIDFFSKHRPFANHGRIILDLNFPYSFIQVGNSSIC